MMPRGGAWSGWPARAVLVLGRLADQGVGFRRRSHGPEGGGSSGSIAQTWAAPLGGVSDKEMAP